MRRINWKIIGSNKKWKCSEQINIIGNKLKVMICVLIFICQAPVYLALEAVSLALQVPSLSLQYVSLTLESKTFFTSSQI